MPNRLSRILSRTKEKEAEAQAETNNRRSPSPPPAYGAREPSPPVIDQDDVITPADMTSGFKNLTISSDGSRPSVEQCIAHLKVLESFYRLRQTVSSTDGLFGIEDKFVRDSVPDGNSDRIPALLAKLAEKRWAIYVSRAVERFETWLITVLPDARPASTDGLVTYAECGKLLNPVTPLCIAKDNVPPVDVLMVWHAYMLNPRAFLEDCLRSGWMQLWHTGMPWQAAVECIDSETFAYEAGDDASKTFTSATGLPWNNLDDIRPREVACPRCYRLIEVAYTTCDSSPSPETAAATWDALSDRIDSMMSSGHGFCDQGFKTVCASCSTIINHDSLSASKFCKDVQLALSKRVPMGGTVLGVEGIPWKYRKHIDVSCKYICVFPNEIIRAGAGRDVLDNNSKYANFGMQDVRSAIEKRLKNRGFLRLVRAHPGVKLGRGEKISIRRMVSRYWNNSSPFALDLVGAVVRQGSFIEKMHNIDWLHSPALPSTMGRLITKYTRFVGIMRDKSNMAVPTLDVDLAWHTHQLAPYSYFNYTVEICKQFIDHDDKVAETALNDSFAWTSKMYQKLYGEPYSECTCWYCEAIRESHTSSTSRILNAKSSQANDRLHGVEQDPSKSVHISTHNAVRPRDDSKYNTLSQHKAEELERHYLKACERASKKGRKPPNRDDYYYSNAYGHPVYIPAYAPFVGAAAFMPMYYAMTPGCMALGHGAHGNCCSGTCGGGVAAGACAGASGGACAGGAAGGCGSGGACGGGGCGGGGGGGGGGFGGCGGGGGGGGCGGGGGGGGC